MLMVPAIGTMGDAECRGRLADGRCLGSKVGLTVDEASDWKMVLTTRSSEQIKSYRDVGFISPIRVLSDAKTADVRVKLEAIEAAGSEGMCHLRFKPNLLFTCFDSLIRHPKVLDAAGA